MVDRLKIAQAEERHMLRKQVATLETRITELEAENARLKAGKVKALEWRENGFAHTDAGIFYRVLREPGYWKLEKHENSSTTNSAHSHEVAAKAAAQADYERRILAALEPAQPDAGRHPSHKTRVSLDASSFDEICDACGATDISGGGWGKLAEPCPATQPDAVAEGAGEGLVVHPLAKFGSPDVAPLGLYRVHWKSGGTSLASIGMMENGDRWIAPTNWTRPATIASAGEWGEIDRLELLDPDAHPSPTPAGVTEARRVKVPDGQTPLDDNLCHRLLDVLAEGRVARDNGTRSPYHGHSLEHCLHAAGWVSRDLRLALDEAQAALAAREANR